MNSAELQTILQTLLREQESRFIQILDSLRASQSVQHGGTNATAAILSGPQDVSAPQLPNIEAFVENKESSSHFEDWLTRFQLSLQCTAPNLSDKEKAMLLATKLSTDAFAEFRKGCLPKEVTDFTYEETVTKLRLLFTKQRSIFAES
jgi:hypothetical protein